MKFLDLSKSDLAKGFTMTVLMAIISSLYTILSAIPPHFPTPLEIKAICISSLITGAAYLLKNWLTNSDGKFLKSEPKGPPYE